MSTTTTATNTPHILVYPFPAPGHIIPLLDLTHHLLNHNLTITFLINQNNFTLIQPFSSHHSSSRFHHVILPDPPRTNLLACITSLRHHHYPIILNWFQSHTSPPVAILSNFFLGWTHQLASQVGIPRIVFSPSGAFAFSVTASLWLNQPRPNNPDDMDFVVSFPDVPNSPSYPWWQISHIYRTSEVGDPNREFFRDCFVANLSSWGILVNSFTELEPTYFQHLKKIFGDDRVFAVGPLQYEPTNRGGSSSVPCHEVTTWLEKQKDDSVIYICFGSREMLTCKQMDQLVSALEKSRVHFIWCVRQPDETRKPNDDEHGSLPDGFEDRVAGRGFIIKGWAPQLTILKHRAVGAFLTHCGWNSVVEGVACGVVLLTWPLGADQFINAELVVEELGVGVRVGEDTQKIPESDELAQMLAESVDENRSEERVKSKKLKQVASNAVNGGSSYEELNELVKRLMVL